MRKPLRVIVLSVTLIALAGAAALAAAPTKGGEYRGRISQTGSRLGKGVIIKVSENGKTARAAFSCGTQRAVSGLGGIKIDHGRFKGVRRTGAVKIWSIAGRFTSRKTITARLRLYATCDGEGALLRLKLRD